jgi:AcrR family transcriptional regulator
MGLREQKRQQLRASVIENGIALFLERGFEQVTVREIAARSEISEATFFNHFATKDALLSRWAYAGLDSAFSGAAAEASSLRHALREVARCVPAMLEPHLAFATLAWRRARIGHLTVPGTLVSLVDEAQHRGELRRDLPASELARIFASVAATTVGMVLSAARDPDATTLGTLRSGLQPALDLTLDGSRRRHERVKPGASHS